MLNINQVFAFPSFLGADSILSDYPHLKKSDVAEAQVSTSTALLKQSPSNTAETVTQLLYGEPISIIKKSDSWYFVVSIIDAYTGWIPMHQVSDDISIPTHQVTAPSSHVYAEPSLKSEPLKTLPMNAYITITGHSTNKFLPMDNGDWIYQSHVEQINTAAADPIAIALSFLGTPYLWGGRSRFGIDCSGLVQISLAACGSRVHRDTGPQYKTIGRTLTDSEIPQHGDLAFFPGHVGWMLDNERLLHANATHMAVTIDPIEEVIRWVSAETDQEPFLGFKRLSV